MTREDDLTDNVMIQIGSPALVTLFLPLEGEGKASKMLEFNHFKVLARGLVGLVTVCRVGKLTGVLTIGETPSFFVNLTVICHCHSAT